MARFKFGKKKKDDETMTSSDLPDRLGSIRHLYLRRPSTSSRNPIHTPPETSSEDLLRPAYVEPVATGPAPGNAQTPWKRHKIYDSPFPRYRHAASLVSSEKNELFLMGGLKEGLVFGDTWRLVPQISPAGEIDSITAVHVEVVNNNNPPARVGHSSVLCGNAYIIYGGDTVDTDYNGYPDDNFYMFNINNCKYTIPSHILGKPRGRYGHLIGVVLLSATSSRLYLFGGQLENDVFNDLYHFELTSFKLAKARWELVEPLNNFKPPPLTNHSMCVHKTKIYIFGGVYNNEKVSNDVWCFDTLINKWLQVATSGTPPLPVNEHSAAIVNDRLYVYGGNDFSGAIYDLLHCLDLHSFKWAKLGKDVSVNGPGPRCGHSMSYLPKLNKLLIMGGDKNDYIYSDAQNYDTYENFDGEELGTMVYELDLAVADHFLQGGIPKKIAASAGAAGVLNRRAALPLPSEDYPRHRRSFSAGIDDFRTPNASIERLPRSLDPAVTVPEKTDVDTPERLNHYDAPSGTNGHSYEPKYEDKFVDVDLPSSSAISEHDATSDLEEIRDKYIAAEVPGTYRNDADHFRHENNETPVLSTDFAHILNSFAEDDAVAPLATSPREADVKVEVVDYGAYGENSRVPDGAGSRNSGSGTTAAIGAGAAAVAAAGIAAVGLSGNDEETRGLNGKKFSKYSPASSSAPSENDAKVKRIIAELNNELAELKTSTKLQMQKATEQIQALETQNQQLKSAHESDTQKQVGLLSKQLKEKDAMIEELRNSVDPSDLEINDNDETSIAGSKRGYTELTKYKLNRLELNNKLVYLENENSLLKDKLTRFEPYMNNQIGELATFQKIIKGQEEKISKLTAQVKLELVLHKEIALWKHKHEDLQLEYDNYRLINEEVDVSDDEGERELNDDDAADSSMITSGTRKSRRQISSHLENLVLLWQTSNTTKQVESSPMVPELQKQVDELLKTSKQQHEGSSAEVQALEEELQAKLQSLRTYEENYRDALLSVNNTSKALDKTQDEMKNQKYLIEKLVKENNELKMYKQVNGAAPTQNEESGLTSAHYNMKVKDLEADLYILKQERDQLNETVSGLKKELYLAGAH